MQAREFDYERKSLLLVDTCSERGSVALRRCDGSFREAELNARAASSTLLSAVRKLLYEERLLLGDLAGIAVVSGPGSFTGIRIGLAVAKGLCVSAGLPVIGVSRLAMLARVAGPDADLSVLRAGRNEVYVRDDKAEDRDREWLSPVEQLRSLVRGRRIAFAEETIRPWLTDAAEARLFDLSARMAFPFAEGWFAKEAGALAALDANYVRDEQVIYRRRSEAGQ